MIWNRRSFIKSGTIAVSGTSLLPGVISFTDTRNEYQESKLSISLAQWSLHRTLKANLLDHLDFPKKAVEAFGIFAVEYVNTFFKNKATDTVYLTEMNNRTRDLGVKQLLIMIDEEGGLAEPDDKMRNMAVFNHQKWVDAAAFLGCHSIRVNAHGSSDNRDTLRQAAVDGLGALGTYGATMNINVIVENHGGLSSDGSWLSGVIREVNMPNVGTLPDFGNFCIKNEKDAQGQEVCLEAYDRYLGVAELLPFARAVSAKSYDFDDQGNETSIDYKRMLKLIRQSDYNGYLGIEYEGTHLTEDEGILATKKLLERLIL